MKQTAISVFVLAVLAVSCRPARADGILLSWSAKDVAGVKEVSLEDARNLTVDEILELNRTVGSWPEVYLLMVGATGHKENAKLLDGLVAQVADGKAAPLTGTSRLIIWERITTGEILFEGKGLQVSDDLFSVGGRANWMLRNLTKKNFGYVTPSTTEAERADLRKRWARWREGEQVSEYRDPYESKQPGLEEIRSPEAIEALIVSLRPSEAKDRITKHCLTWMYGLEALPEDPTSPAKLCNPDTYTHGYLAAVTGIKEKHDPAWWAAWWTENRSRLVWNSQKAVFEVK